MLYFLNIMQIYNWQSMEILSWDAFETRIDPRISSRDQGRFRSKADSHVNIRRFRQRRRQRNFLAPFNPVSRINRIAACPSEVTSVHEIYKCVQCEWLLVIELLYLSNRSTWFLRIFLTRVYFKFMIIFRDLNKNMVIIKKIIWQLYTKKYYAWY